MEKIEEQLNNLNVAEIPASIHDAVLRKVNYIKYKPLFFIAFGLLVLTFLATVWHINAKLIDAEFLDMISDFFEVFDSHLNFTLISMVVTSFFEIISPVIVVAAILSLFGAIYTGTKISLYQFSKI